MDLTAPPLNQICTPLIRNAPPNLKRGCICIKIRVHLQKRSNCCLPKVTSFFIQAAGLVYHQPRRGCISSIALRWYIITAKPFINSPASDWTYPPFFGEFLPIKTAFGIFFSHFAHYRLTVKGYGCGYCIVCFFRGR